MAEVKGPEPVFPTPGPEPIKEDPRRSAEALLKKLERLAELVENASLDKKPLKVEGLCPLEQKRPAVTIAIQEAPRLVVPLGGGVITLHATNRIPPAGGFLTWTIPNPAGVVNVLSAANLTTYTLQPVAAGSDTIHLSHTYDGQTAQDTLLLEVVDLVTIAEVRVPLAATGQPNTSFNVSATGIPAGGVFTWGIRNANIVRHQFGPPGDVMTIPLIALAGGTTQVDVAYLYGGVRVRETVIIDVIGVRITEAPLVARQFRQAGQQEVAHVTAWPAGGVMTWALSDPCVDFQGAVNPGPNARIATLEAARAGRSLLTVTYTLAGVAATDQLEVVFVQVQLNPGQAAALMHAANANPNQLQFQAVGIPPNGILRWFYRANGKIRFLNGIDPGNNAQATFETVAPGNTSIEAEYTSHNITVSEYAAIDVVGVSLTPDPIVVAMHRGVNPNTVNLTATGTPSGGQYTWDINAKAIADFSNDPGNNAAAVLETRSAGSTAVTVQYDYAQQSPVVTVPIDVVDVVIQGPRTVQVPLPALGLVTQIPLQAVGTPNTGTFVAWNLNTPNIVSNNGVGPIQANVTLDTVAAGRTPVIASYRLGNVTVTDTITLEVVSVALAVAPANARLMHAGGAAPNQLTLTATVTPNGAAGTLTWQIGNTAVFQNQGGAPLGNAASITVDTVGPGTTTVTVTFTPVGCAAVTANLDIHCVAVSIAQAPLVSMLLNVIAPMGPIPLGGGPLAPPPVQTQLTANGLPAGGNYTWLAIPGPGGILRYAGGVATVANQNAVLEGQAIGLRTLTVRYVHHGVTATATVQVQVTNYSCSRVDWSPANALVAAQPLVECPHGPAQALFQIPQSGAAATLNPPPYAHHHGTVCQYCQHLGLPVYHYVNEQGPAIAEVLNLRNEIHQLRNLLAAHGAGHANVLAYTNPRPWLVNIPANLFNPVGGAAKKMIGVLMGVDNAGQVWRLRAVSGMFPGLAAGAPLWGAPNQYWARKLPNRGTIHSASRGSRNYNIGGMAQNIKGTFGQCAATHLLSQALHLGLQVTSMAEMWIGPTKGTKVDGQLVASCPACRTYLNHMLCDSGGGARGNPYAAFAPPNRGY